MPKHECFSSRPAIAFLQYIEAKCYVKNEDVVGAAPIYLSEWSTI